MFEILTEIEIQTEMFEISTEKYDILAEILEISNEIFVIKTEILEIWTKMIEITFDPRQLYLTHVNYIRPTSITFDPRQLHLTIAPFKAGNGQKGDVGIFWHRNILASIGDRIFAIGHFPRHTRFSFGDRDILCCAPCHGPCHTSSVGKTLCYEIWGKC